jgi:hypothetical protein
MKAKPVSRPSRELQACGIYTSPLQPPAAIVESTVKLFFRHLHRNPETAASSTG